MADMELIWTAFVLGLFGSLHCAVMCGPLVLAVTSARGPRLPFAATRLLYNAGRITTYCAIGALFGIVGKTLALAGLQRWLSLIAGGAMLLGLLLSSRAAFKSPVARLVIKLKTGFSHLLHQRTLGAQFALGAINGLLPCGLVYIAAAGAAATGHPLTGALHMAVFGLGTLPIMLAFGLAGRRISRIAGLQKLVPASVVLIAVLLLLRGMELGIPYLSPAVEQGVTACH
jgi:uncharacterized protein